MAKVGVVYFSSGSTELGLEYLNRAVALLRPTADKWRLASTLNNLGFNLHMIGESMTAMQPLEEALQAAREAGDPWLAAGVLDSLAAVEMSLGRHDEARALWKESFIFAVHLGDVLLGTVLLEGRARLALLDGNPELCVRLVAAADAGRRSIGSVADKDWNDLLTKTVDEARNQLPASAVEAAWREGNSMTVEEVMASLIERDQPEATTMPTPVAEVRRRSAARTIRTRR
jgi:tetratricopeptide (TPR) repeat protein